MITESLPVIRTDELPGPKSAQCINKRNEFVALGVSNLTQICIEEAKGSLIKDVDGNVFLDFASGIGVQNLGHCDDDVVNTIKERCDKYIQPGFNIVLYDEYGSLAQKLCEITPGKFSKKVIFLNSGAEAVENSIKLARKYTKKTGVISLENAFHGRTYMAMTLTSKVKPYKYGFGPFASDTYKIPSPYCYRCPMNSAYPGCGLACAEKLKYLLKGELCADTIACLIAEPIQGEGGFIVSPPNYLNIIQKICNDNGILFIADEIQSGFARTGAMFASEHFEIEPDMMTIAKSIAAGLPLSAVVGKTEIIDAASPGELGGTYAGNPIACAVGLTIIDKIKKDNIVDKANIIGNRIRQRLYQMQEKYDAIGDVRGVGSMLAIEFVKDRQTKEPDAGLLKKVIDYSFRKGVLFLGAGMLGNVLRFLAPIVITTEQVDCAMDILDEAIEKSVHI